MKQNVGRFLISCILLSLLGTFFYYLWSESISNTAVKTSEQSEEPLKTPYTLGSVTKDQIYCSGQQMDVYHPRVVKFQSSPVVLYLHGGGWVLNDKTSEPDQLAMVDGLRDEGYTIAAINYRKLPNNFYPDAVQDSLCAVRYLRAQSEVYGLDAGKVAVYGFSAGGYLAAMVGVLPNDSMFETPEYAQHSSRVSAVITLAGIFDFTDGLNDGNRERIANFLNGADPAVAETASYITPDDPSFMLLHGAEDQYVSVEQDNQLAAILQQQDIAYEQIYVKNAEHGLNPLGGQPKPDKATVQQRMADFLRSQFGVK